MPHRKIALCSALLGGVAACVIELPYAAEAEGSAETEAGDTGEPAAVTWHQDIAPLVHEKCVGCHREGGIAPFSMQAYATAAPWAPMMAAATADRYMPPFLAQDTEECQPRFGWKNDLRLSDEQIALIGEWADLGAPEGDPATAAPLPDPPELELTDADLRLTIPTAVDIEGPGDSFLCFSLDPGLTEETFLEAMQITAGNPEIVHHVLIYLDETGESAAAAGDDGYYECFGGPGTDGAALLGAWAPGSVPITTPEDVAMYVPAGSRLIMNVHYHPLPEGVETDDSTSIDLRWHDGLPRWGAQLQLIGNGIGLQPGPNDENGTEFRIPAGAQGHTETMVYEIPGNTPDFTVWSVGTHMHYVGTDMIMGLQYADPEVNGVAQECLIQTPRWDFNWQRGYAYDAALADLPAVGAGDTLYLRCTYDNSLDNPFVVDALEELGLDAPVDVHLGEETLDEMCLGVFGVAVELFP